MLKKLSLIFLIFGIIIGFIIVIYISNKKDISDEYYTILENKSYVIKDNRRINFTIYSKKDESLITYEKENKYYLILEDMTYLLEDVTINKYDLDDIYLYKLDAKLPLLPKSISSTLYLRIDNLRFSLLLNYGTISLLNPKEYELLSVDDLYASYSVINGIKRIVGINITLSNNYTILENLSIGNYAKGYLSKVIFEEKLNYEIDIYDYLKEYKYNQIEENYRVNLKSKTLFIPISQKNDYITKEGYLTFLLDKKKYYLDTFSFMIGELDINTYDNLISKGVITYVWG